MYLVKLNGCEFFFDKGLGFVVRFCIDLEEFDVFGCCCIISKGFYDIFLNCYIFSYFDISGCICVNSLLVLVVNGFGLGYYGIFF